MTTLFLAFHRLNINDIYAPFQRNFQPRFLFYATEALATTALVLALESSLVIRGYSSLCGDNSILNHKRTISDPPLLLLFISCSLVMRHEIRQDKCAITAN